MIRKLAEELAGLDVNRASVPGKNNIRPAGDESAPVKPSVQGPFTDMAAGRAADTRQGELERSFDNFSKSVGDFRTTIGTIMSSKIEEISGSSAASQAVGRHRQA